MHIKLINKLMELLYQQVVLQIGIQKKLKYIKLLFDKNKKMINKLTLLY